MAAHCESVFRLQRSVLGRQLSTVRQTILAASSAPAAFALVFIISQLSDVTGVRVAFCIVRTLIGIPCPGCGITTSIAALTRGNVTAALDANPAGPFVTLFVMVQVLLLLAAVTRFLPDAATARYSRLNDRALLTFLLLTWLIRLF